MTKKKLKRCMRGGKIQEDEGKCRKDAGRMQENTRKYKILR
jgi:hypothetical protein